MNIPLELVDVLKWRNAAPDRQELAATDENREAFIDHFLSAMYPVYDHMIQFGVDYHNFMDNNDPVGLLEFIDKYKDNGYWRLAKFANGLRMDFDAVKNTLLYPSISNGIVEGINSIIKCIKRVCGGKAKIDLLTAKMVMRHLNKSTGEIGKTA